VPTILDNIRARVARAARPAPRAAAGRPKPLAEFLGPAVPRALIRADFAAGAQLANVASEVARATLPRNDVHSLIVGAPIRMYLFGRYAETLETGAGETTADLDLGAAGLAMARSTREAATLPTAAHPDVRAYSSEDGITWTARNVSAVDFDAGTVTIAGLEAETEYQLRVYYLPASGAIRVRAVQPSGVDERSIMLYNDSLRALHETDQAAGEVAPRIVRPGLATLPLGPKWAVSIEATTAATIPWADTLAPHEVRFAGRRAPVVLNDERGLNVALSAALRSA